MPQEARRREKLDALLGTLELIRTKVDEQPVADAGCIEIVQELCKVGFGEVLNGLQFNDKGFLYEEIGDKLSDNKTIYIPNGDWILPLNLETCLFQTMEQRILVDAF